MRSQFAGCCLVSRRYAAVVRGLVETVTVSRGDDKHKLVSTCRVGGAKHGSAQPQTDAIAAPLLLLLQALTHARAPAGFLACQSHCTRRGRVG